EDDLSMMKNVADQVSIAITRVRDEDSLRKSEERYRMLLENSPSATLVNRNDSIAMINPAAMKLLGINNIDEVMGISPMKFFHPDYHRKIQSRMSKIIKGKEIPVVEEKIIRSDGEIRDIEVVSVASFDSEGPSFQVIMNDITERKLAEKELFDTRNYLQNLIDNANAPIIVWDRENRIKVFNHAFEHLTGYASSEVEGKSLSILFPRDTLRESMAKIRQALTENWKTIEIPILTKSNDIRIILWNSAKIYDKSRKTYSTIAQGNDITERIEAERAFKESREKLELALENGRIGTWEWVIDSDSFNLDSRMEKMLGIEPGYFENTLSGFEKRIHEEDLQHLRTAMTKALTEDQPLDTVFRVKHENNVVNYVSTKALVEKDNAGNPMKMSGVCFDITEMKLGAEKTLFLLNEELLRSNKELEQFAYVASHDLQEPLRMISSFTQLLAQRYKDRLDNDAKDFIQFAVDGAARMQGLINDLLAYSRVQTRGKQFSVVDMHDVLGQVMNNLQLMIQESDALIVNDDLPEVFGDEGQIVQLMQNLIVNGLKFCKTAPRIHISSKEEKEYFLFSVKDNGIGIEPQYFEKIFQIFQRLHPKDKYGGTGIGLAICKRIVNRHGGRIWVESKIGKGSVFYFTILKRQTT
ncbi:MAG: PAS domain S-box protein, partial [Bacteroidota bacterium]|nr:PAS domain S-box protein [Bacteroidota bacterium]